LHSGTQKTSALIGLLLGAIVGGSLPVLAQQGDESCLFCHADAELFVDLVNPERLVVTAEAHEASLHGEVGLACVDCHQDLADADDFPHGADLERARCGPCHEDIQEVFDSSVHGYALKRGNPRAPACGGCHGAHDIAPSSDPDSATHHENLPSTCATCHGTAGLLTNEMVKLPQPFASYSRSVHGHGCEEGMPVAASCADCHGVHDLRGVNDPDSRINRANISATCGQCHQDVHEEYDQSIHGLALRAGVSDSPTCNDCHGEHLILSATDPDSRVYSRKLATETCGTCHDDPVIIAKYRLQGGVVGSYVDSYHGWATRGDYASSASCVSCHTAHAVLPEAHPESTVHPDNVLATCQKCHESADYRFAASYTHEAVSITANPVNKWIRTIYIGMILAVIGGMLLHNLVILNYYAMEKRRQGEAAAWVRRMDLSQVIQHMLLTVSFIALVVTGFALRFPEAWWVRRLAYIGMSEPVRANLHRIFAGVLVLASLYHVYYLVCTRRGLRELKAIAPAWLDVKQFLENMQFYTWQRKQHVRFGRYDYTQKAEYWALVWGTLVMAVTGFVLWFPEQAVRLFPWWAVTAAQTIHYYEAWLATLAIIVWHLFFVMFHPEAYPMSWTWITGKMDADTAAKHHPQWYREEQARQAGPETRSQPRPRSADGGKRAAADSA
jgi:formate dehydrogenase gamma subunit